jgi:radical SAM superfamily enzyme YgiQ (UPF0313 family)
LVEQKGIQKKCGFAFAIRANLVDEELCEGLKRMNATDVGFGAESGSDRILKLLHKGTTVEVNQRALDTLYKHRIPVRCSFIVGSPTETEEEVRMTYEFFMKNLIDGKLYPGCAVNIMMPMPGTEMWHYAIQSGIIDLENMDWNRLSIFASYRDSNIKDFSSWVERRRKNNSVYLAEDTLPQERLYELMYIYENAIQSLEKNKEIAKEKPQEENTHLQQENTHLQQENTHLRQQIGELTHTLQAMESTIGWKLLTLFRKLRNKVIPLSYYLRIKKAFSHLVKRKTL